MSPDGEFAHDHKWEIELACPRCGNVAPPVCAGWTPNQAVSFGRTPTVFANVSCAACGANLQATAGGKLRELFDDVATNGTNRWLIVAFVMYFILLVPLLLWGANQFPAARRAEALIVVGHILLIHPVIRWFNKRIAALRNSCPCGDPQYKFLGMLGRSYCYRCSACGRLLRLRD